LGQIFKLFLFRFKKKRHQAVSFLFKQLTIEY